MDKATFSEMALAEMGAVYRLAVYLSNAQEADDLVQETYVRAFRSMATFRPGEHGMRPWLFKILHNVLYDRLSENQRRRLALDRLRDDQKPCDEGPAVASVANQPMDWEQVDGRLRTAIDELPLHHRSIFLLSAVEGLRYREIAAIEDVPIGTVMSRLCRARATLASQLTSVASERGLISRAETTRAKQAAASETPAQPNEATDEAADERVDEETNGGSQQS